jgi:hypothetical protein
VKSRYVAMLLCALMALSTAACTPSKTAPETTAPGSAEDANAENAADEALPITKLARMTVEGQPMQVELTLFETQELPFVTYIPTQDFEGEAIASNDAEGARFNFNSSSTPDQVAYLEILIPTQQQSVTQLQELILGEEGLFVQNNWEMLDRTEVVSYPWAAEKIVYQQQSPTGLVTGSIFMGEEAGQVFYVVTHYPAEYGDGFEPRAALILENLAFTDDNS